MLCCVSNVESQAFSEFFVTSFLLLFALEIFDCATDPCGIGSNCKLVPNRSSGFSAAECQCAAQYTGRFCTKSKSTYVLHYLPNAEENAFFHCFSETRRRFSEGIFGVSSSVAVFRLIAERRLRNKADV